MNPVRLAGGALVALLLLVVALKAGVGEDRYTVSVPLANASGLDDGSAVKIGGLDRGKVKVRIDDRDRVLLDLELDDDAGPIGKDASVAIVAANFLGLKRVELDPGNAAKDPAPDGYVLKESQATTPTDLDQVLGVFDADTRTRAKILLNAAGEAVVGRKVDVSVLLKELPLGMEQAGPALQELATTDATMTDLVERSDRFVAQAAKERRELTKLVDTVGGTTETVAARRAALRAALAKAPGTLDTLRGFLGDLEATTADLGPAAREIRAAAPALASTLGEVETFRKAATPALASAVRAAPGLSRLANGATPVLRRSRPTLSTLSTLGRELPPVTTALDNSADNVIAVLENWSRAIQLRDQLGHVFRGEASISPDLVLTMVDRLTKTPAKKKPPRKGATKRPAPATTPAPEAPRAPAPPVRLPKVPGLDEILEGLPKNPTVDEITDALQDVVGGLTLSSEKDGSTGQLLDFLLGP
ncbi:MlaD family protein [Paraconexibacter algicola]|uniref:Mce/MlaD domain-containing protein n=1 Tax=Paraconexibacter algicola TaxID=2133960 RepID=A0A2T4UG56_9ACTN|nr:MlaD family protein [Paraconexibacter algicola]PTL58169.1 hypothetical protein C7Y72_00135 [Paraconexibacter algicola]